MDRAGCFQASFRFCRGEAGTPRWTRDQKVEHYYWDSLPREAVRPGVTGRPSAATKVLMVMNWLQPGMQTNPQQIPTSSSTYIVSGTSAARRR